MQADQIRYRSLGRTSAPGPWASPLSVYLALKEIWRNKGRYLLIGAVVALITTLVLFIAGLAEGLGRGNRELIENLKAEVLLYQANVDLTIPSSRLPWSKLREVRRVPGVADVGPLGFSNISVVNGADLLSVSLIGVEPGRPGEPQVELGQQFLSPRANEVIIDRGVAFRTGLTVGETIKLKSVVGAEEEIYDLEVIGISQSQQYSIQPSIFAPYQTWDKIRPRSEALDRDQEFVYNLIAVETDNSINFETMAERLQVQVSDVEAVDRVTAYENTPGYGPQQSTLGTQRSFTLLIGVLVLGGFFRIQALQKVAQVGMLKAIGASNWTVIRAAVVQIVLVNLFGIALGCLGTFALSLALPPTIPIVFTPAAVTTAVLLLLLIGPLGGLASMRTLLKAEPLTALGLSN